MYVYHAQGMNGRNNQQNPSQCRNDYAEPHERPCHMLCLRQSEQGIQSAQNHQDCQHRLHIAEQHNIHILVCTAEHIGHTIHYSAACDEETVNDSIHGLHFEKIISLGSTQILKGILNLPLFK